MSARSLLDLPRLVGAGLLLLFACGDSGGDGDATGEPDTDTTAASGATDPDPTTGPDADTGSATTPDPTVDPTGEVGPNFGLLTFTRSPADASGTPEQLGMAGAWRTTAFTTDDFYAVRAYGSFFPLAPTDDDAPLHTGPGVYDWGDDSEWLGLGNGMRLGDAVACLQMFKDAYPLYLSDDAANLDPACAPDPALWQPATDYDLSVYGNDDYPGSLASGARTPAALTVSAPDITAFNFPVDTTQDLAITWTANGEDGDRIVIRLWDQFGEMITVRAADDGSYTIPGTDLAELSTGDATLTISRERVSEFDLAAGTLRVVARHEVWAYPNLF